MQSELFDCFQICFAISILGEEITVIEGTLASMIEKFFLHESFLKQEHFGECRPRLKSPISFDCNGRQLKLTVYVRWNINTNRTCLNNRPSPNKCPLHSSLSLQLLRHKKMHVIHIIWEFYAIYIIKIPFNY